MSHDRSTSRGKVSLIYNKERPGTNKMETERDREKNWGGGGGGEKNGKM